MTQERIEVATQGGNTSFYPEDVVEGTVSWQFDRDPEHVELRLFWSTRGKGEQDQEIVQILPFAMPRSQDHRPFRLHLPEGPWSFSGKLISLAWALELVAEPGARAGRLEITLSPTGREILLHPAAGGLDGTDSPS